MERLRTDETRVRHETRMLEEEVERLKNVLAHHKALFRDRVNAVSAARFVETSAASSEGSFAEARLGVLGSCDEAFCGAVENTDFMGSYGQQAQISAIANGFQDSDGGRSKYPGIDR